MVPKITQKKDRSNHTYKITRKKHTSHIKNLPTITKNHSIIKKNKISTQKYLIRTAKVRPTNLSGGGILDWFRNRRRYKVLKKLKGIFQTIKKHKNNLQKYIPKYKVREAELGGLVKDRTEVVNYLMYRYQELIVKEKQKLYMQAMRIKKPPSADDPDYYQSQIEKLEAQRQKVEDFMREHENRQKAQVKKIAKLRADIDKVKANLNKAGLPEFRKAIEAYRENSELYEKIRLELSSADIFTGTESVGDKKELISMKKERKRAKAYKSIFGNLQSNGNDLKDAYDVYDSIFDYKAKLDIHIASYNDVSEQYKKQKEAYDKIHPILARVFSDLIPNVIGRDLKLGSAKDSVSKMIRNFAMGGPGFQQTIVQVLQISEKSILQVDAGQGSISDVINEIKNVLFELNPKGKDMSKQLEKAILANNTIQSITIANIKTLEDIFKMINSSGGNLNQSGGNPWITKAHGLLNNNLPENDKKHETLAIGANICFMNSILQAILHNEAFYNYFINKKEQFKDNELNPIDQSSQTDQINNNKNIIKALWSLFNIYYNKDTKYNIDIRQINYIDNIIENTITPDNTTIFKVFKDSINANRAANNKYDGLSSEDTTEILDIIISALKFFSNTQVLFNYFKYNETNITECKSNEDTSQHDGVQTTHHMILLDTDMSSVSDGLIKYTEKINIQDSNTCSMHKNTALQYKIHSRTITIDTTNTKYIIICLKKKPTKEITVNKEITIDDIKFHLDGVVCFVGKIDNMNRSGHYTFIQFDKGRPVKEFNDEKVHDIENNIIKLNNEYSYGTNIENVDDIIKTYGYIIFYKKNSTEAPNAKLSRAFNTTGSGSVAFVVDKKKSPSAEASEALSAPEASSSAEALPEVLQEASTASSTAEASSAEVLPEILPEALGTQQQQLNAKLSRAFNTTGSGSVAFVVDKTKPIQSTSSALMSRRKEFDSISEVNSTSYMNINVNNGNNSYKDNNSNYLEVFPASSTSEPPANPPPPAHGAPPPPPAHGAPPANPPPPPAQGALPPAQQQLPSKPPPPSKAAPVAPPVAQQQLPPVQQQRQPPQIQHPRPMTAREINTTIKLLQTQVQELRNAFDQKGSDDIVFTLMKKINSIIHESSSYPESREKVSTYINSGAVDIPIDPVIYPPKEWDFTEITSQKLLTKNLKKFLESISKLRDIFETCLRGLKEYTPSSKSDNASELHGGSIKTVYDNDIVQTGGDLKGDLDVLNKAIKDVEKNIIDLENDMVGRGDLGFIHTNLVKTKITLENYKEFLNEAIKGLGASDPNKDKIKNIIKEIDDVGRQVIPKILKRHNLPDILPTQVQMLSNMGMFPSGSYTAVVMMPELKNLVVMARNSMITPPNNLVLTVKNNTEIQPSFINGFTGQMNMNMTGSLGMPGMQGIQGMQLQQALNTGNQEELLEKIREIANEDFPIVISNLQNALTEIKKQVDDLKKLNIELRDIESIQGKISEITAKIKFPDIKKVELFVIRERKDKVSAPPIDQLLNSDFFKKIGDGSAQSIAKMFPAISGDFMRKLMQNPGSEVVSDLPFRGSQMVNPMRVDELNQRNMMMQPSQYGLSGFPGQSSMMGFPGQPPMDPRIAPLMNQLTPQIQQIMNTGDFDEFKRFFSSQDGKSVLKSHPRATDILTSPMGVKWLTEDEKGKQWLAGKDGSEKLLEISSRVGQDTRTYGQQAQLKAQQLLDIVMQTNTQSAQDKLFTEMAKANFAQGVYTGKQLLEKPSSTNPQAPIFR